MTGFLDELKGYVGWSEGDTDRLRALEPILRPRFAGFAEHFYEVVARHPRAAAVFTGGEASMARHVSILVDWMSTGLLGPHDGAFHERRSRIGRRHVDIGLPQEYMFTAMNVLRLDYHAALAELVPPDELIATIGAVDKLFDLELAIMLRHYQLASEEHLVEDERRRQIDKLVAMQTLSAGLAHEVRNPLNAAKLQLELLDRRLRRVTDDDRLRETVDQIEHEVERLTRLLNEFLAFAQPPQLATAPRDLVAKLGDPFGEALTLDSLAFTLRQLGRHAEAVDCHRQSIEILLNFDRPLDRAKAWTQLAQTHEVAGDAPAAQTALREALRIYTELGHPAADELRTRLASRTDKG